MLVRQEKNHVRVRPDGSTLWERASMGGSKKEPALLSNAALTTIPSFFDGDTKTPLVLLEGRRHSKMGV